jgi:hypothetical protein
VSKKSIIRSTIHLLDSLREVYVVELSQKQGSKLPKLLGMLSARQRNQRLVEFAPHIPASFPFRNENKQRGPTAPFVPSSIHCVHNPLYRKPLCQLWPMLPECLDFEPQINNVSHLRPSFLPVSCLEAKINIVCHLRPTFHPQYIRPKSVVPFMFVSPFLVAFGSHDQHRVPVASYIPASSPFKTRIHGQWSTLRP